MCFFFKLFPLISFRDPSIGWGGCRSLQTWPGVGSNVFDPLSADSFCAQRRVQSLCKPSRQQPPPSGGAFTHCRRHRGLPSVWGGVSQRPFPLGGRCLWAGRGEGWGHLYVTRQTFPWRWSSGFMFLRCWRLSEEKTRTLRRFIHSSITRL